MLLFAVVCAVICRPTEKEETSIHKHKSIGIVHVGLISDTGVDEVWGVFDPEALERSLEKSPEKIPPSELGKQLENPLEKENKENVEHLPMQKEGMHNPIHRFDVKEWEKNPPHLPEQKEKDPFKVKDVENLSLEREQRNRRDEPSKNPLLSDIHKLQQESQDKLQEHKARKDSIEKPESRHKIPAGHRSEAKDLDSEKMNLDKPKLGSENVNLGVQKLRPESENVDLREQKLRPEKVNLDKSKLGSENVKPEKPKEHLDELKQPKEPTPSPSFPSILEPPRVMSKRSLLDGFPMGDIGTYDERSRYRLPGSTDIGIADDRPRYGMGGGYDDLSRYRVGDPYGDPRYGRPDGMDRPVYDDRYPYGSDTLVDIRMK